MPELFRVNIVDVNSKRYYLIDGRKYPSVTTVLSIIRSPALEQWRGKLGNVEADRIRDEAAEIGTKLHRVCHLFNSSQPFLFPSTQLEKMFAAYHAWFKNCIEEVIATEMTVWSEQYGYAGTIDLVAVLKGDVAPSVIDLKTSKDFWPEMALQLAGYREALIEMDLPSLRRLLHLPWRRLVVQIDKVEHELVVVKEYTEHQRDFNGFLAALSLFRYYNK